MTIYDVIFRPSFRKYVSTLTPENSEKTIKQATEMIERFAVPNACTHIERAELPNGVLIVERVNDSKLNVEMLDEISYTDVSFHIEKASRSMEHAINMLFGLHSDMYEIVDQFGAHDVIQNAQTALNEIITKMSEQAAHAERVRRERNERFTIFEG